ncbi:hypothetical protein OROMI_006321 [Orobanche minor]
MAAFMTVLESDLRALSAEARRRYPAVKDAAEHAILKLRSLASPNEIALNEDIFMIFVMACEVRNVKLSVIGLSCLQKLISHDAIAPSALTEILNTLKERFGSGLDGILGSISGFDSVYVVSHGEMADESIQLKTLQTILIIFQSRLQPDNEENMARALGICLRLLENNRSSDSVRNTAAATFRQAVALIFDHVLCAESLPAGRFGSRGYISRTNSVTSDVNRNIKRLELLELDVTAGRASLMRETLTKTGKLGLCLLQDLTTLAAGGSAIWLRVDSIRRSFALDLLEFVLFCIEGEIGEPYFRRLVLRSVAHVIRFYSSSLTTESEGVLNPNNSNVVEGMVKALARVISTLQYLETGEESLAAVAGMFSSKAKGIEWSLDTDASNAAVLVASEAHAISLAIEGLLGVVFAVATLTDEAVDDGELGSQGEAIILEILKGYQAFTQACGVLRAVEPLNSFLASLCKFTIYIPNEAERGSVILSPSSKRAELGDQRESIVLTSKNVQALRTLFNIAHRLHNVLGPSWVLVLETLSALDRAIHSSHATTQEVSPSVPKLSRDPSGQYSDFNVLSSLNSQLFESSALMHVSAVKSLLSALRQLSCQCIAATSGVESLWDDVVGHFLELADSSNPQVHTMALDALDKSICAVLSSDQFQENVSSNSVRAPHDRHGEKLRYSWPSILEMLRSVAHASEKDLIALGFQSLRVIMNDGLPSVPFHCLHECISVAGAYSTQKTELNISLTAIGLLWIATDFIVKGLMHSANEKNVTDQRNYDKQEEPAPDSHDKVTETAYFPDAVEHDKLLFSVFSLLHGLGADERPEVRNSAIRMLFQTLGSHGQKLSKSMWEDCLWNYVFPMLDHASHLAATSSKDEWQGKELGTRKGKSVHMLIHHSRNTAQKQWDETLGLLLGGITRIFRSFFPFLRSIRNFQSGWESLLVFIKNCILNGSKEVALAAINCLQSTVVSHSLKENFPVTYIRSVLDIYEAVLLKSPNSSDHISDKVKQEILHGLGELYSQAQGMFNSDMYKQLILVVDSTIREAKISSNNFEADYGHVPPVQRTILEILPLLRPAAHLSSLWILLLMKLLHYLPAADPLLDVNQDCTKPVGSGDPISAPPDATFSTTQEKGEEFILNDTHTLFTEKLVPVLVDLFLLTPVKEKYDVFPNVIQSLGRCMTTRRDDPDGTLWRLAVDGFHRILIDDVEKRKPANGTDLTISRSSRIHVWKEVADVYELFLVGHCGRALPSNAVSAAAAACQTAESLEMSILDILGDKILRSDTDIPLDVLQRLISTLDRCASRTCCLPLETVELMPSHCSRFSLACLHKLFCLSSGLTCSSEKSDWSLARFEVSKISIVTLMSRCDFILRKLLTDEKEMGVRSFPPARMEEVIVVLEELAQLEIHPETASSLHLHPRLLPQEGVSKENMKRRSHLLILFHSFCELVLSRELRVRELVQVLLQLTAAELGLQKLSSRLDEVHDG